MTANSPILKDNVPSNRTNKKIKFIIGGAVIVALIGYLIVSSISSEGAYFREVGEVLNQKAALTGKNLRVSGKVVTESIVYDAPNLELTFNISDPTDVSKQLPIHFHGVQPDQIGRENTEAIVEGSLGANGTVDANNLLLKCPSRYEEGIPKDYEEVKVEAVK
jgi:cytochrome c-type biogenesis protein CcmE